MAVRSLTATPDGIDQINRALTEREWSRGDLAKHCDCSRQPAVKFCSGKAVSKKLFVAFCKALELDWEEISGQKPVATVDKSPEPDSDIDALVQAIRQKVYADIHHRCGTMRVLDMEQPIGISDIYTSVNVFEKLSKNRRPSREETEELLKKWNCENFDRLTLGQVPYERVPGLVAVERYNKLMIFGKPGAGKTTFMKRLATLFNQGKFQARHVPVFVTLKEFAEAKGKPELYAFIAEQWQRCGIENAEALMQVLKQGRALVLLDGLDEVQEADHDRILQEIKDFTNQYRDCQFAMTCRIAAREYVFQDFTEVEVADFSKEQITEFASKWFKAKQAPEKGKTFIHRLETNRPIQELATNPLLLTLLCLVFGEAADFPANRSELYKEGLDVLLKKWDAKRNIERDQVYKKLSLKRREDLLSQLAFETFERGDSFFKQKLVERYIINYIRNLPEVSESEEALQLDGEAVLKSIEAQHGLLVERARNIYSFSHLTFQEYFAAKQITRSSARLPLALADLAAHINEKRYREIFLLAVGMLPEADDLLILVKQQIDLAVASDDSLQQLFVWIKAKSESVDVPYKSAAVRAFYLALALDLDLDLNLDLDLDCNQDLDLDLPLARALDLNLNLDLDLDLDLVRIRALDRDLERDLPLARALDQALVGVAERIGEKDSEFKLKIQSLQSQLPSTSSDTDSGQWWEERGKAWTINLRAAMIQHRDIGHDWQFTDEQREKLQQYYNANKLLIECLNSDCYVTKATRQHIEETLLLPAT